MFRRRHLALIALLLGLLASVSAWAEDEKEDLSGLSYTELAEVIRTRPPTPALTAQLQARGGTAWVALRSASWSCRDAEALHVIEHAIRLGWLDRRLWGACCALLEEEMVLVGVVRRITHPGLHAWWVEVDVRDVLRGSLTLTQEETPLQIGVRASGGSSGPEVRWITNTWEAGTELLFCASRGELFIECPWRVVPCVRAWGGNVWEPTGREQQVLQLAAPLAERDPARLLEGLRSEDETVRWLSTAATILACRAVGESFAGWYDRSLSKRPLSEIHDEVVEVFVAVMEDLVWDPKEHVFRRQPAADDE